MVPYSLDLAVPPTPKGPSTVVQPSYSPVSPLPIEVDSMFRNTPGVKAVSNVNQIGPTPKADGLSDH